MRSETSYAMSSSSKASSARTSAAAASFEAFARVLHAIGPTRIQINSLDRPAAYTNVLPADAACLMKVADALLPLPVELVSRTPITYPARSDHDAVIKRILGMCANAPSSVERMASTLSMHINELTPMVTSLASARKLIAFPDKKGPVYSARIDDPAAGHVARLPG